MDLPAKHTTQSGLVEKSDEDLLLECEVETFRSTGKGGQHVNKTESGVRVRHLPSGIVVTCRRERSQYLNKKSCLRNLRRKLEERSKPVIPRVATRPTFSSKKRRVVEKKIHGQRKSMRRSPEME